MHFWDNILYRRRFDVGDVAMFFPVPLPSPDGGGDRRVYIAFNEHCPNRYLADGSTSEFKATGRYPTYVIGRIVRIEGSVAGSGGGNPYLLPAGTPYFVVTVSAVEWG